jgi:type I restriction enzyme S subunit
VTGWPVARLDECCQIVSGATPSTSVREYWGGDIPWVTPKDLGELATATISDTPRKLTTAGLAASSATLLPPGSVLFSSRAPIGHVAINTVAMATNQGFKSFVPNPDRIHAPYLYWWLEAHRVYLQGLGNGATFKEVSKTVVSRIEIPLPPLPEQRRIADVLDQAESLRAKRRHALAQLDGLTRATFVEMFGSLTTNPRGYPVATMIELVDPKRPITYGILKPGSDVPDGIPYVRVVDMTDRSIHSAGLRRTTEAISLQYKRSVLRQGDLLLSIRGQVGRLAMVEADVAGANITQDTARLAIANADPIYVLECLRSPELQQWMKTFTKGAAVRGINLTDVKRIQVPLPPASDQRNFAYVANAIERMRQSLLMSTGKLELLFASLQHRAFRDDL